MSNVIMDKPESARLLCGKTILDHATYRRIMLIDTEVFSLDDDVIFSHSFIQTRLFKNFKARIRKNIVTGLKWVNKVPNLKKTTQGNKFSIKI